MGEAGEKAERRELGEEEELGEEGVNERLRSSSVKTGNVCLYIIKFSGGKNMIIPQPIQNKPLLPQPKRKSI